MFSWMSSSVWGRPSDREIFQECRCIKRFRMWWPKEAQFAEHRQASKSSKKKAKGHYLTLFNWPPKASQYLPWMIYKEGRVLGLHPKPSILQLIAPFMNYLSNKNWHLSDKKFIRFWIRIRKILKPVPRCRNSAWQRKESRLQQRCISKQQKQNLGGDNTWERPLRPQKPPHTCSDAVYSFILRCEQVLDRYHSELKCTKVCAQFMALISFPEI